MKGTEMPLDPQITVTAVASTGVGALMLLAGVEKHALEWRRRRRICPSCGRQLERHACGCTRD